LGGCKVRVWRGAGCRNTGVENERYDGEEEVDVEEGCDFLAACVVLVRVYGVLCRGATDQQR
jgi:hypothetical protein